MINTLLLLFSLVGQSESLTIAPVSFTFHNFRDTEVEAYYKWKIGKQTTIHPGLHLKYEAGYLQTSAWYFRDSFGRHAGGLMTGPKKSFGWFTLGVIGGIYVREYDPANPMKFPLATTVKGVSFTPLAFATGSLAVPVSKNHAIEIGCGTAWLITNCSVGLQVRW